MPRKPIRTAGFIAIAITILAIGFSGQAQASQSLQSAVSLPKGIDKDAALGMVGKQPIPNRRLAKPGLASGKAPAGLFRELKSALDDADENAARKKNAVSPDNSEVTIGFEPRNGTPVFIKKPKSAKRSARKPDLISSRKAAKRFLSDNRDLLKLDKPDSEMKIAREWTDDLGCAHFRFQQTHAGLAVWGKETAVHLDADESVYLFQGRYEPSPKNVDPTPEIASVEAVDIAKNHMGDEAAANDSVPELVIHTAPNGNMFLAYKIGMASGIDRKWTYFVDAKNGAVLHRINRVHTEIVSAGARDLNSQIRTINVWSEGGKQYLVDPSVPLNDPPFSPVPDVESLGNTYILDADHGDGENLYYITYDNGWDPAGVSAAHNTRTIHDYYFNIFGRNGIDDRSMNYLVVVHFDRNYPNAFWNGKFVVFGDGDNQRFSSLGASLDITAHEIQHGVTEHTAGLIYENQSGALNEGFSDIFACMVDRDDWTVGEGVTLMSPGYLRNLADPSKGVDSLPRTMSEYRNLPNTESGDWGGVHINMSIPSRAAYLVAEGLSIEGLGTAIGRTKTERIFYRALDAYLQASSQFSDARLATIQAAEELYGGGSAEAAAVQAAWDAVEVYGAGTETGSPQDQSPTDTDAISGDDMMVYLYPYQDPDTDDEYYYLYRQITPKPFTGYNPELDSRNLSLTDVSKTRPAVLTTDSGTVFFYVGNDYNLYSVFPNGTGRRRITRSGDIWSFAISPDGRYYAYTSTSAEDNNIYVGDIENETERAYPAVPKSDLPPGETESVMNTIFYVSALSFDYTGRIIVFDALNCLSTPDDPCSNEDGGYRYWSVGFLDLNTGEFEYPFPNQSPDYDIAYPSFAYNNNYVIALDVIDYTNYLDSGLIESRIWTLNWKDGTSHEIVDPNSSSEITAAYGVPSFWGDDDYITFQAKTDSGSYAYRIPIDGNWAGNTSAIEQLNDYEVVMPVMHRAGVRNLTGAISASAYALDFGSLDPGQYARRSVTLSNTGNRDVNISGISISGSSVFTHNGTNALLPRDQSMTIKVTYSPGAAGRNTAALVIDSDADSPRTSISLSGSAQDDTVDPGDGGTDTGGSDDGGGGGGGGCFIGVSGFLE